MYLIIVLYKYYNMYHLPSSSPSWQLTQNITFNTKNKITFPIAIFTARSAASDELRLVHTDLKTSSGEYLFTKLKNLLL